MSQSEIIKINCPKCHKTYDFKVYRSINVGINKELKEDILNFKIFKFNCDCGVSTNVFYPFLYHDSLKQFMIQYSKPEDVSKYEESFLKIINDENLFMNNEYVYRIVDSPYLLIEKTLLLESIYDDRIIEIMKEFIKASLDIGELDKLLFAKNKDKEYEFIALDKNNTSLGMVPFDKQLYQMVYDGFYDKLNNRKDLIINQKWALDFLNEVKL